MSGRKRTLLQRERVGPQGRGEGYNAGRCAQGAPNANAEVRNPSPRAARDPLPLGEGWPRTGEGQ